MDAYDCRQTDKQMQARIDKIFLDPKNHKFYSCHDAFLKEDTRGPRGGKIKGKKRICFHCGQKAMGHALTTKEL